MDKSEALVVLRELHRSFVHIDPLMMSDAIGHDSAPQWLYIPAIDDVRHIANFPLAFTRNDMHDFTRH